MWRALAMTFLVLGCTSKPVVYGIAPDYSNPWSVRACASLASSVNTAKIVKDAGGDKAKFMAMFLRAVDDGEAQREISDAWDAGMTGHEFYETCMNRLREHLERVPS